MYAIIDVETTGGSARWERITEIAIVLHDGEKVVNTFSTLLNPERSIPWNITQITGITDEMVAHAPRFFEIAKEIVQMTDGCIFVAHNVTFDYSFVKEEFARLGYDYSRKQLCTVRLARKVFPGLPSYSLSNLKKHFNIQAEKSHRALDDTLATTQLFEKILAEQTGKGKLKTLVNQGVKETKLPAAITLDRLHEVPELCGVYYFHNERGEVIYVGKSLNIRKRLFEHFADPTPKGEKLRIGVADFSWEVTGSELVALLLESSEIKRLQPPINRAQRIKNFAGAIFSYTDQNGYKCLAVGKRTLKNANKLDVVAEYAKLDSAKSHLQSIVRQWELCFRLANLDSSERACFHYSIKKCHGACIGEEAPESYNERVNLAISQIDKRLTGTFMLLDKGRQEGEAAMVVVQDGQYQGYCFLEKEQGDVLIEDILESLTRPAFKDPDAGRIIHYFTESKKGLKTIPF
jgi:DNA polymerase-3 subunit epsilon